MEGRTKFNYGTNGGLITMKDINYMFSIVNSDLSEEEKAIKLYSFCNKSSLINNAELYNILELEFFISIINCANSRIVLSDGLPRLTGPMNFCGLFIILIIPSTRSET